MWRQALRGISKRFSSAALMGACVATVLVAQDAMAACRGAWAEGTAYHGHGPVRHPERGHVQLDCGCAAGKQYYGRGPLQISWNGNYCAAGNALGVDLKNSPELVATNATTSWGTAFWFWMTQMGAGTMTAHNAMVNNAGFGQTIRTINGSLECNGNNVSEMQDRVNYYNSFTSKLGVSPGANTGC